MFVLLAAALGVAAWSGPKGRVGDKIMQYLSEQTAVGAETAQFKNLLP